MLHGGQHGHWVPLALSKIEVTHMGHVLVALQTPGNRNIAAYRCFLIAQDNESHGVVQPCTFHCHLGLC